MCPPRLRKWHIMLEIHDKIAWDCFLARLRQLALPIVTWQGAWVKPAEKQLARLRTAVERAILGTVTEERSRFLVWAAEPLLGPEVDPVFLYDLAALRHEIWI